MAGISTNYSYNFDNLKIGSSYNVIVYVKDINDKLSNEYIINVTTNDTPTTIEDICSDSSKSSLLVCHILSQYNDIQGNNGIYYHNSSLINGAGDNSYRYAGASDEVNNYVCFGSTASTCPSDNLYRIIGVFGNQVKLIKADYTTTTMTGSGGDYYGAYSYSTSYYKGSMSRSNIAGYLGNSSGSNIWSTSALNATNLNGTYLNSLGSTWGNKIATTGWKVGGMTWTNGGTSNARTTYNYEVGSSSSSTTYSAKIGLMYVSDYGFAASPSAWTTNLSSYSSSSIRDNNWMYMGLHEWTISRRSDTMDDLFYLFDSGTITYGTMDDYSFPVRPCFYLNSDVQYVSGSGTESDPIRIQ